MDEKRADAFPNVPTFIEQGYDITYYTWRGMALPKGVDAAIVKTLVDAFAKGIKDEDFLKFAKNMNLNVRYLGPDEFAAFLKDNFEAVTKTLEETHLLDETK